MVSTIPEGYVEFKRGNAGMEVTGENWLIHRQIVKEVYQKRNGKKLQVEINGISVCEDYATVKVLLSGKFNCVDEIREADAIAVSENIVPNSDGYDSDFPFGQLRVSNYNGELN